MRCLFLVLLAFSLADLWGAAPAGATVSPASVAASELPVLTRIEQIRGLSPEEAARGYRARLKGVVTLADPLGLMYVQDSTGGIFVSPLHQTAAWTQGRWVEVVGDVAPGSHLPFVRQAELRDLGPAPPPEPRRRTLTELADDREDSNWVEVRGVIRSVGLIEGRPTALMEASGLRVRLVLHDVLTGREDVETWVDAAVRVQAVCGVVSGRPIDSYFLDLHVPNVTHLIVERPAPKAPEALPLRTAASLAASPSVPAFRHRVLLRGTLEAAPDGGLLLRDATGVARLRGSRRMPTETNRPAEVFGFPVPGRAEVEDAVVRVLAPAAPTTSPGGVTAGSGPVTLPMLLEAAEVRALKPEEAARGYPVRLRGVVMYWDPTNRDLFIHDETAGVYVWTEGPTPEFGAGFQVEIEGFSDPGQFAPMVTRAKVRVTGSAAVPRAQPRSYPELLSGRYDAQRVELQGVIRSGQTNQGRLSLRLALAGGDVEVVIPGYAGKPVPSHLVDAEVRSSGVCGTVFNQKRQLLGVWQAVSSLDDLLVVRPAPVDPYTVPLRPIASLLRFDPGGSANHRVRVRGTVTYRDPRWNTLFVQEGADGLYVKTLHPPTMVPGDVVEVVGFVSPGTVNPVMTEAVWRNVGLHQPVAPVAMNVAEAAVGRRDAQLISIRARLVDRLSGARARGLVLQFNAWTVLGLLEETQDAAALERWAVGSELQLTGVCSLLSAEDQPASAFRILLRSPADVVLLREPGWLTPARLLRLLGAGMVVLAVVVGWVLLLRRQVRRQTLEIRRKVEREATLEARYRDLFERANDMVFGLDLEGKLTELNPAGQRVLGYPHAEVATLDLKTILPPDQRDVAQRMTGQKMRQGGVTSYELEVLSRDGRRVPLEISSWLVERDGRPAGVQGIAREIAERRRTERLLREREEYFRSLIENAIDLIAIVDEEGVIRYLSPSTERILGYRAEQLLGANCFHHLHPEDVNVTRIALHRAAQRPARPQIEVVRLRHRDGGWRTLEGAGRAIVDDAAGRKQFVLNLHDITERKRLEDQLRQAQKMEAIGQLAGGVAHDFNNILTVIQGHCSLLLAEGDGAPPPRESLAQIAEAAQRAGNLTRQLLTFSRRQVMRMRPLDLNRVLNGLVDMLRRLLGEHIALELETGPGLPAVEADESMMDQVVINLSVNARDAMPRGGRLRLRTEAVELDAAAVGANSEARAGRFVCLSVSDTGCGMEESTRKHLFEPFFTTKDVGKGTGLGLATVYGVIKQHQGWAEVDSAVGQGTTFRIYLPVAPHPTELASAPVVSPAAVSRHESILLVEDEAGVRQLAKRCLIRHGYRVLEASTGVEALALWRDRGAEIDLLFTDMVMPEGLTGLELAQQLRAHRPDLKVLISSGYSMEMVESGALERDRVAYLPKPYEMSTLVATIRKCLDGH